MLMAPDKKARYSLLQRVAPLLRHNILGNFHPLGLLAELVLRHLNASNDAKAKDFALKLQDQTRVTRDATLSLFSWLSDEEKSPTNAGQELATCIELVSAEFAMRGIALEASIDVDAWVQARAIREVFLGSLLAVTDQDFPPQEVRVRAVAGVTAVEITIDAKGSTLPEGAMGYRITESDVQSLAELNSCHLMRSGTRTTLRVPCKTAQKSPEPNTSARPTALGPL